MSTISKFFLCLLTGILFVSLIAFAGERHLGTIISARNSDGGVLSRNNATADASYSAFVIPSNALLSVQCDQDAYIGIGSTSTTTVTSSNGVLLGQNQLLPTSVATGSNGYVAVISATTDGGASTCKVFERRGNE